MNELLIKPLTAADRVSYAELVNPRGLPIDFFISHYWGEDFGKTKRGE